MAKKGDFKGVWLICPCGKQFYRWACKAKRARTCSKECQYKYARRPSGLDYFIKIKNQGWFEEGHEPLRKFPKGHIPFNFLGDKVGYDALHDWVKRHAGKASKCEHCGSVKNIHWANKSWEYQRDLADWLQLCAKCHQKYDRAGPWGSASQRFPEMRRGDGTRIPRRDQNL